MIPCGSYQRQRELKLFYTPGPTAARLLSARRPPVSGLQTSTTMLSSGRFFGWKTKHQGPRLYPRTFHNQERRSEMDPRESFPRSALADRDLCRRRAPRPTPRLVYDRSLWRRTGESENASATGDAQRGIDPPLSAGQAHVKQRQLVRQTGDLVDDNE